MRRINFRDESGFTILELMVVVVVLIILGGFLKFVIYEKLTGSFTVSPPTVAQAPGTGTFIYNMTRETNFGKKPERGRSTTFTVRPKAGVRIISLNGRFLGTQNPDGSWTGATSGTQPTDNGGNVTVVLQIDYIGTATLEAKDGPSGQKEIAQFDGV